MSIVALKRKTQSQYNNVSVGQPQFSINGTRRLQGYVGQTSLSRSLPRTLMRGNTICGHGGVNGTYPVYPVVTEGTGLGTNALNDPSVVKSSVLDTKGQLMTQYPWIRRPAPTTSVKPDTTLHIQTQEQYIDYLRRQTMYQANTSQPPANKQGKVNNQQCCALYPQMKTNYRTYTTGTPPHSIAKPNKVITQGDYIKTDLANQCNTPDYCARPTKASNGTPFACNNVPYVPPSALPKATTHFIVYIP
jgi:hypothetical protein